jgi:hypothetical protein
MDAIAGAPGTAEGAESFQHHGTPAGVRAQAVDPTLSAAKTVSPGSGAGFVAHGAASEYPTAGHVSTCEEPPKSRPQQYTVPAAVSPHVPSAPASSAVNDSPPASTAMGDGYVTLSARPMPS